MILRFLELINWLTWKSVEEKTASYFPKNNRDISAPRKIFDLRKGY